MSATRVGSYEIVRILARGGMAVVYLAHQPALGRDVALKRLSLGGDPSLAQRFVEEARVVARLDHPNIVTVLDFCEHDGEPFIAMEYVSGGSLRPHVRDLTLAQALGVLDDVLSALDHAASRNVTHRDLKPENLLVTTQGTIKITDFGIALAHDAVTRLTNTGVALGTPAYMAPEQAGGGAPDHRTDLYALGVVAYELLAGRPPFPPDGPPLSVLYRHIHEPPPPLAEASPGVPPALAAWVHALLEKDPDRRPQRAAQARRHLEEIAVEALGPYWRRDASLVAAAGGDTGPVTVAGPAREATAETVAQTPGPSARPRRRTGAMAAGLVGAIALAALVVAVSRGAGDRDPPAKPARRGALAAYAFAGRAPGSMVVGLPHLGRRGAVTTSTSLAAPQVVLPAAGRRGGRFGAAAASGDFDRDGFADLAVGEPGGGDRGQGAVTVLRGSAAGLRRSGARILQGPTDVLRTVSGRYGTAVAAGDLDGDGYADLAVGGPGVDPFPVEDRGSGAVQLLFGGPGGLAVERARRLHRPRAGQAGFGGQVAIGDLDRDGHADVIVASRLRSAFCPGTARGPVACRDSGPGGSALLLADVTGDGMPDVVAGDPSAGDEGRRHAGAVRILRGTPGGPARTPVVVRQNGPHIPGHAQAADAFGASLAAGDLDRDGFADLLVGAPGEDRSAGRVTLVRGGPGGYANSGNREFEQHLPGVPGARRAGHRFGAALLLAGRPRGADVVIASPGEGRRGVLWVLRGATEDLTSAEWRRLDLLPPATPHSDALAVALWGSPGG